MTNRHENLDHDGRGLAYESGYRDGLLERNAEIANLTAELRAAQSERDEAYRDSDRLAQQLDGAREDCKQLQGDLDDAQSERFGHGDY